MPYLRKTAITAMFQDKLLFYSTFDTDSNDKLLIIRQRNGNLVLKVSIVNHDSGFIIGITMIFFAKILIEHTPKSHLKKYPSA